MRFFIALIFLLHLTPCLSQNKITKSEVIRFLKKVQKNKSELYFCNSDSTFFNSDTVELYLAKDTRNLEKCYPYSFFSYFKKRQFTFYFTSGNFGCAIRFGSLIIKKSNFLFFSIKRAIKWNVQTKNKETFIKFSAFSNSKEPILFKTVNLSDNFLKMKRVK